ncbi:MAG: c-type cytochrome [Planctomycetota bacterium]|nr:c-type cytochrome [Planctomycetota bacterium]MDP6990325.1 c-type cytochrome [Planctomycetota bacterium]
MVLRGWTSFGLAVLLLACGGNVPGGDGVESPSAAEHARAQAARRDALRDRLARTLGRSYDEPLPRVDSHERAKGARVYERLCAGCHGRSGRGGTRLARALPVEPGDLADPARAGFFSERAKLSIVAEGSPDTPMTGWQEGLEERTMIAVLDHMRTLVRLPARSQAGNEAEEER